MKLTKKEKTKQKKLYKGMVDEPENYKEPARLNVDVADLPAIKDWDVGETYTLTVKVEMISKSEGGWSGKEPMKATFEVESVKEA